MKDGNQNAVQEGRHLDTKQRPSHIKERASEDTIDLSDAQNLDILKNEILRQPGLMQEKHRGAISKMLVFLIVSLFLILPLVGGLIAAFGSVTQAQAYSSTVVTLLEATGKLALLLILPILTFYFVDRAKR